MKRLNYILGALALATVVSAVSPAALAQENGNKDEYGKTVRGPYETNRFGDNWFIGAGGGVNVFWNDGCKVAVAPSIDAYFGKWFTPSVGIRAGYQGFQSRMWTDSPTVLGMTLDAGNDLYQQKFGYMYVHGDFLWNISNGLGGYKETRFWNLVPYLHAGYYRSSGIDGVDFFDNELAAGAGLIHDLRLTDRLNLIIDMRATAVNGRVAASEGLAVLGSVTAGLSVDLGYPGFVRTSTALETAALAVAEQIAVLETAAVALEAANEALTAENLKLINSNRELSYEINKVRNTKIEVPDPADFFEGMMPAVFFEIGQTELSPQEMSHLEFIAESILAKADACMSITITVMGTADKNTGSLKRNESISKRRGQYVYDILTQKYGIEENSLVLTSEVVEATGDPSLERAVVFSF